jgi:hypothetical protein
VVSDERIATSIWKPLRRMGMRRGILTLALILALTPSAWAETFSDSIARQAAKAAAEQPRTHGSRSRETWAGAGLLVGGVLVAFYGFGHPTGPMTDTGLDPTSFPHRTGLGLAGLGIAAIGGILSWHGAIQPSIEAGPRRFSLQHRVSF